MKVLCAVDGSQFSHWAAEALMALASQRPKSLVLLHVLDTGGLRSTGRRKRINVSPALSAVQREGKHLLQQMAQEATTALGLPETSRTTKIQTVLMQGKVAETIVGQAKRRKANLLMLGSRGLSDASGFLLGSVSRKVVARASCPVLVVKRQLREANHIVLALDGSKHSEAAAEFLRDRIVREATKLTLLSVAAPIATDLAARVLSAAQLEELHRPAEEEARALVSRWREVFLRDGCAVTTEVLGGPPSQRIVAHLEHSRPDLVVVGSRGLTGTERLQLGSVSETVVKYAPCSVLVVKGHRG